MNVGTCFRLRTFIISKQVYHFRLYGAQNTQSSNKTSGTGLVVKDISGLRKSLPLSEGPGGRSSTTGRVVTVFGCTGFLGKYIVHQLAKQGDIVIAPFRGDEDTIRDLRVTGDLGKVLPVRFDLESPSEIMDCIRHSHVVINCIAKDYETLRFTMDNVNIEGAAKIARACKLQSIPPRLFHISCLKADKNSPSHFLRTKAIGEEVVFDEYPHATIARMSVLYGHEDRFLNSFGFLSTIGLGLPIVRGKDMENANHPFYPLYVGDAAYGLSELIKFDADSDYFHGKIIQFVGPEKYTMKSLADLFSRMTLIPTKLFPVPIWIYRLMGLWLFQWKRAQFKLDQIRQWTVPEEIDPKLPLFTDIPGTRQLSLLENRAVEYLRYYRGDFDFNLPAILPNKKQDT